MSWVPETSRVSGFPERLTRRGGFGALMLVGFVLGALPVFLGLLNHDVAWLIHVASRLMEGGKLYAEIPEINPPLIVWLNLASLRLARALGVSEIVTLRLLMLGVIAGSLLLCGWTLRRVFPDRVADRRVVLALALFILIPLVGYDFAQREHLMLALVLPYLLMASGRARGRPMGVGMPWVVGLVAGVGIAIKPHFLLLFLAIEVDLGWAHRVRRSWLQPEALGIAAFGLVYAVAVVAITPEYFRLIGWARSVYAASGWLSWSGLASEPAMILTGLAVLGFIALRPRGELRECSEVILIANLSLMAVALIQNKGFSYHFYPPLALAMLLVGLLAAGSREVEGRLAKLASVTMRGTLAALVLATLIARVHESLVWRGSPGDSDTSFGRMVRLAKTHADGGSIFAFSPSAAVSFPLVTYSGTRWASNNSNLGLLTGLYARDPGTPRGLTYHSPSAMGPTERLLFDGVIDDMLRERPTLLFVDVTEHKRAFRGHRFDFLDYYSLDPRFVTFLKDYEVLTRLDEFQVYRRKADRSDPGPIRSASGTDQAVDAPRSDRSSR